VILISSRDGVGGGGVELAADVLGRGVVGNMGAELGFGAKVTGGGGAGVDADGDVAGDTGAGVDVSGDSGDAVDAGVVVAVVCDIVPGRVHS